MADQKISQLPTITGANMADDDKFVLVDTSGDSTVAVTFSELKNAFDTSTGFVRITGDTMTGNLSLGDNNKAIFGAGSDLQIFHDGSNSYIQESGTGNLFVRASNLVLADVDGTQFLRGTANSDVKLYHNNNQKLATTTSGIDITGTVVSNGMSTNTSGTSNFIAGVNAGNSITSGGNYNVIVGDEAGTALTTGDNNLAVGKDAGKAITTGSYNVLLGALTGDALTVGNSNVSIGESALSADTLGSTSIAIGRRALRVQNFTSATSNYNVAIGHQAGTAVTTATNNVLIGGLAGDALTTGGSNLALGTNSLGGNSTGTDNVAVGTTALKVATGSNNTAVGDGAGSLITSGAKNSILGRFNGNQGGLDLRTSSNNIVLSDGDGNPRITVNSSGSVGMGTVSPQAPLDFGVTSTNQQVLLLRQNGNSRTGFSVSNNYGVRVLAPHDIASTGSLFGVGKNNGTTYSGDLFTVQYGGNCGIGTVSPEGTLQVENSSNNALILNAPANRYNSVGFQTAGTDKWWLGRADSDQIAGDAFFIGTDTGNATDPGGLSAKLVINSSGSVGISQPAPTALLHVGDGSNVLGTTSGNSLSNLTLQTDTTNVDSLVFTTRRTADGNTWTTAAHRLQRKVDTTLMGYMEFGNNANDCIVFGVGNTERARIDGSGNLLVGATAPIDTGSHLIKAIGDTLALDVYTSTSTAGRDVFAVRSDIGGTETKVGVIEANGDFQSATNSYGSISDQSVKQDIVDANSQMEDVKNIRLRNYRLIDHVTAYGDDAKVHLGVVAQELEAENMDGLVSENADGVKGVRYSVMLLKALGALQETITMVEDLQVENTQIKARLTALEG